MIIRTAEKRDIPDILELIKESIEFHRTFDKSIYIFNERIKQELQTALYDCLERKNKLLIVAEDGALIGYARASIKSGCGCIGDIIVTESYRLKGVGTELINHACRWFKKRKLPFVSVNVSPENMIAVKFYEKLGFKKRSLTMTKELTNMK